MADESEATLGYGIAVLMDGVEIAELTDVNGPGFKRDAVEVTHHKSPGRWREFIKGLKDGGEVTLSMNFLPAHTSQNATTGILSDFGDDTIVRTWSVIFPDEDETTWAFPGIVTSSDFGAPTDDKLTCDATIKVSGQPTLA